MEDYLDELQIRYEMGLLTKEEREKRAEIYLDNREYGLFDEEDDEF